MTELHSGLYVHKYSSLAQRALLLAFSRSLTAVSFAAFGFPLLSTKPLHFIPGASLRRILDTKEMASHTFVLALSIV